jgi:hypothetical protein
MTASGLLSDVGTQTEELREDAAELNGSSDESQEVGAMWHEEM